MRLSVVILSAAVPGFLLTACGGAPLPESYGIYAQGGRSLVQLEEDSSPHRVGPAATLLVFDKIIGSGLLGSGGAALEDLFALHEAAFVRYEVERVKSPNSRAVTEIKLTQLDSRITLDSKIPVTFSPVKGESEMLSIRPREELPDGLYSLWVNDKPYYFVVGLDPEDLPQSASNRCQDKHSDAREKSQGFSWADWMSTFTGPGESRAGNWLESTGYKDCAALDREAQAWREAVATALATGDLRAAFAPTRLFKAYKPQEGGALEQDLLSRIREAADAAFSKERWQEAADLASLFLQLQSNDAAMARIAREAQQRVADAAAAEKAEADERYAARFKASYTPTRTLGRFTVISDKVSRTHGFTGNDRHPIEITDVSVRGLAYLRNSGWITSTNNLEDDYWFCWVTESPVAPRNTGYDQPGAKLTFRNVQDWLAVFATTDERDQFIEMINAAKQSWYEQYGDLVVNGRCPGG